MARYDVSRTDQGISERSVLLFVFERGSDSIAVAAVGIWNSGLMAISTAAISTADLEG